MSNEVPVRQTIDPEVRWEEGVEHDPRTEALYKFISEYDYKYNGDSMMLRAGGDGDIGEELMYVLDEYFASSDREDKTND